MPIAPFVLQQFCDELKPTTVSGQGPHAGRLMSPFPPASFFVPSEPAALQRYACVQLQTVYVYHVSRSRYVC